MALYKKTKYTLCFISVSDAYTFKATKNLRNFLKITAPYCLYCPNFQLRMLQSLGLVTLYWPQQHTSRLTGSAVHQHNVVFSVCAQMDNAAYIIFIMWNSISGLDAWYYFRFNISCGVAVTLRSHQIEFQVIF